MNQKEDCGENRVYLVHLVIKIIIMKKYLMFACAEWLLAACEKPVFEDAGEDDPSVVVPGDGEQMGEVLWTENDTARFYLSGVEVSDVVLGDCPTPSSLITDSLLSSAHEIRGCSGTEVC